MNSKGPVIECCFCDFENQQHTNKLIALINHYMSDPMGSGKLLTENQEKELVSGLAHNKSSFVLFILLDFEIVGLATCFINFSTFEARPYINIHDVIIQKEFRGQGLGKKLLNKVIEIAVKRNYCKVTLEVRDDNKEAKELYQQLGFYESEPIMHFWTKVI